MSEPMSDEQLARLRRDNEPLGDHLSGLTADEVGELLAEMDRLRADAAKLRTEYGARVTYADTLTAEGPIADTLDEALEALAAFDAKGHAAAVSRELIEREVSEWHGVGSKTAQQAEDGDRG